MQIPKLNCLRFSAGACSLGVVVYPIPVAVQSRCAGLAQPCRLQPPEFSPDTWTEVTQFGKGGDLFPRGVDLSGFTKPGYLKFL
jgi:hypothetical protein